MTTTTVIQKILNEADRHQGDQPSADFVSSLNAVAELSQEQRREARLSVVKSISKIKSPSGAGFIGIWLGGVVENGANPDDYTPYLLEHFKALINQLSIVDEALEEIVHNDEIIIGLEYLGQSLVAHVSRSKKYRDEIMNDIETMNLLDEFAEYSVGVTWLYELLIKYSSDLIVLHAKSKVGVRVRYENISNCFHLFTLLQETLVDIMPREEDEANEDDEEDEDITTDHAWWHYGQGNIPDAGIGSTVWGEMSPQEISIIDGEQVLILWPKVMVSRSWDDGFFHPLLEAAPAGIELLEVLSETDVEMWRKKLKLS